MLGGLEGRTVAVWGLAFKGGTDDVRESPAIDIIALLRNEGATVRCFDPAFTGESPLEGIAVCPTADEACDGTDALAILTDWPQFRQVDLERLRSRMAGRVIFDGRNMLNREAAEAAGFTYAGVGRPERPGVVEPPVLQVPA
jgi:UDPglucose 6-dehydrogenase